MKRDGRVTGFTPISSIIIQLEILRQMWQNQLQLHRNGGSPDKIFALENVNPSSPAFQRIEQEIKTFKQAENKHGNMLWTGKLTVHELQQLDKMQFQDVGLYVTGLIAMQWGIPRSSIPYIVGSANTKDDTGGNSERGYWDVIRKFQLVFADTMNTQLWIPKFKVKIVFDDKYINRDMQKSQTEMANLNNLLSMQNILMKYGKQLAMPKTLHYMGLTDDDLEDVDLQLAQEQMMATNPKSANGIGTTAQQSNRDIGSSDAHNNERAKKREEAVQSMSSRGTLPREMGKEQVIQVKQQEAQRIIDINAFVKIFNEDKAYNMGPPRILRTSNSDYVTLEFASSDFTYKTVIPTIDIDKYQVLLMNLGTKIYDI
jgi:hypothetical protein